MTDRRSDIDRMRDDLISGQQHGPTWGDRLGRLFDTLLNSFALITKAVVILLIVSVLGFGAYMYKRQNDADEAQRRRSEQSRLEQERTDREAREEERREGLERQKQIAVEKVQQQAADKGQTPVVSAPTVGIPKSTGKVAIEVTWKYNNFVGHKPDTDSAVFLIPKGQKLALVNQITSTNIWGAEVAKNASGQGAFVGVVSGTGKARFAKVPNGEYSLVIVSENTRCLPALQKSIQGQLATVFTADNEMARLGIELASFKNVKIQTIQIESGDDLEISHDFGITAY